MYFIEKYQVVKRYQGLTRLARLSAVIVFIAIVFFSLATQCDYQALSYQPYVCELPLIITGERVLLYPLDAFTARNSFFWAADDINRKNNYQVSFSFIKLNYSSGFFYSDLVLMYDQQGLFTWDNSTIGAISQIIQADITQHRFMDTLVEKVNETSFIVYQGEVNNITTTHYQALDQVLPAISKFWVKPLLWKSFRCTNCMSKNVVFNFSSFVKIIVTILSLFGGIMSFIVAVLSFLSNNVDWFQYEEVDKMEGGDKMP